MRGPKPAPPELRLIRGDKRQRGTAVADPARPASGEPTPPAYFDAEHLAKWREVIELLREQRTLGRENGAIIELYVLAVIEAQRARAELAKKGPIITARRTKVAQHNPWRSVARDAEKALLRYAVELGLTPSSRSRVARTPESSAENPFSAIG